MLFQFAIMALILLVSNVSVAATFEVKKLDGTELIFIFVDGEFAEGDSGEFNDIAIGLDNAIVMFNSPGGLIAEGLSIGRTIFIKRFDTGVGSNSMCASACGLAWLAGKEKFAFPSSRVGFHAIYTNPGSNMRISSAGNALVGAYLQRLGFNDELIIYATDTVPTSMQWLTTADAERFRLNVTLMPEEDTPAKRGREVATFPIPERVPLPTPRPSNTESVLRSSKLSDELLVTSLDYKYYEYMKNLDSEYENRIWLWEPGFGTMKEKIYIKFANPFDFSTGRRSVIFLNIETNEIYKSCSITGWNKSESKIIVKCNDSEEISIIGGISYFVLNGVLLTLFER